MHQYSEILDVYAREILDSRGNPTVEVEVPIKPTSKLVSFIGSREYLLPLVRALKIPWHRSPHNW